jgi:hypothetical protein
MLHSEESEMKVSVIRLATWRDRLAAEHPELDQPDGDVAWDRWLEGRQRLETVLLSQPPEVHASA